MYPAPHPSYVAQSAFRYSSKHVTYSRRYEQRNEPLTGAPGQLHRSNPNKVCDTQNKL